MQMHCSPLDNFLCFISRPHMHTTLGPNPMTSIDNDDDNDCDCDNDNDNDNDW